MNGCMFGYKTGENNNKQKNPKFDYDNFINFIDLSKNQKS